MSALENIVANAVGNLIAALAKETGAAIIDEIVKPLVVEFGADVVRGKVDYVGLSLASADLRADKKFGLRAEIAAMVEKYGKEEVYEQAQILKFGLPELENG